jgi:deoxyribodipyrimidine photo-lyase
LPAVDPASIEPGEVAAMSRLDNFATKIDDYEEQRDFPGTEGTSRLSIDVKYGWIGPREVATRLAGQSPGRRAFIRQLAWRDFYAGLLFASPETVSTEMKPAYRRISWRDDPNGLAAWKKGQTGYPIVDAGMRQLSSEGWMHNRVRLITASFLVKDLLIDWRLGERHFRRLLLDADVAQNVGNWQWVAGTGSDAAPYFRVFNPVTQSRRFDPEGTYIRRWVPEIAGLPSSHIHQPWRLGPLELSAHGVELGVTYPDPVIDHQDARRRAIEVYRRAVS